MMKDTIVLLCGVLAVSLAACGTPHSGSMPLSRPSAKQVEWQRLEYYMFVHFGPNTFTDREWGHGDENPDVFCPTALDCRQWAATARAAGMKGIILTAKHHDGFCLWPSSQSTHTVRESKWRDGRGDVLRELAEACREYGIGFGLYVSPWDRNHPAYGTPAYNGVFAAMLKEVLTGYGDVFELWLDGANGEGPAGRKQVYDWKLFHETIYGCCPDAVVFSDVGPDCRWIGNEEGCAGETCWARLDTAGFQPGIGAPAPDTLNRGNARGAAWVPGEADVSIRPGWFHSSATDGQVKSVAELFDIYCRSVGRNANLLLNVPADRRGRIPAKDSLRLMELRGVLDSTFARNLADGARCEAEGMTSADDGRLTDGDPESFWQAPVKTVALQMELPAEQTFDMLLLSEYIPLGQSVAAWSAEYLSSRGVWKEFAHGTTVGHKRIVRFEPVTAQAIRLRINRSLEAPALAEVGLYCSAL